MSRFHGVLLDHSLHCYAVDPQFEGTHAGYILELIDLLPNRETYYEAVLRSLPEHSSDGWDRRHRYALARMMAEGGSERARKAMYESYVPVADDGEGIGVEFVELDGIAGLLFVAAKQGELLLAGETLELGWAYSNAEEKSGEAEVAKALEEAAKTDPRIDAWRRASLVARQGSVPSRMDILKKLTYAELRQRFAEFPVGMLLFWGKHASVEDVSAAADGLKSAHSVDETEAHLAIFADRAFPGDAGILVTLARAENGAISRRAAAALTNIRHSSVRELALEVIGRGSPAGDFAIEMLSANLQPGDYEVAVNWFEQEQDVTTRHRLGIGLRHLIEAHPSEEFEGRIQTALYEWGPCSFCRKIAVERLLQRGELSAQVRAECLFDSNDEIRALVV